jgi:hypothetical protein
MIATSDLVIAYLGRRGPTLERDVLCAVGGGVTGETGVFVAVLSGMVERVTLLDGANQLRLTEEDR